MPAAAEVRPCSKGNVALTFDDGPRPPYTTKILDTLKTKRAPATFFVIGMVADRQPALLKRMHAEGHRVGNHSWSHPELWSMGASAIRSQLGRTNREIRSHGLPRPTVMRPPYAATNSLVRSVAADMGLAHVLWEIDTSDWKPGTSAASIRNAALSQLEPGGNILMHDGVGNSGATAAALPGMIDDIRGRGYCIGALNDAGRVVSARPKVSIAGARVKEGGAGTRRLLSFQVSLSVPTSRTVKVSWETANRTGAAGRDYASRSGRVEFTPGSRTARVRVPVFGDNLDEYNERFVVRLSEPRAATIAKRVARGVIVDDDAPVQLRARDATAVESVSPAKVRVELSTKSGKPVTAAYKTVSGSARAGTHYVAQKGVLTFRPGQTRKIVPIRLIDRPGSNEGTKRFRVSAGTVANATIARGSGVVSIADDPKPTLTGPDVTVREDAGQAKVVLYLSRATKRTVTVGFATKDGTAKKDIHYDATSGTVTFRKGTRSRTIWIAVTDDLLPTGQRQFDVAVYGTTSAPVNAVIATRSVNVTIVDNDPDLAPMAED